MDKLAPKLIRRAAKKNYIAIIIDPIYKVITGDENSADQMANFCNQFDKVCTELGCAVIYCHHHSKGSQGGKRAMDRASGSGAVSYTHLKNNQGKTSVLDAIVWALGGNKYKPSNPVREGSVLQPHLKVVLDNGFVVERKGKNSDLKVIDPKGNKAGQTLLSEFIEEFALNVPKFMESSNKEKANILDVYKRQGCKWCSGK